MLIARTIEESEAFIEWTNEEIDEVLMSLPKTDNRPYLFKEKEEFCLCYENRCVGISEEMFVFMKSDIRAYERLSTVFMESLGFDPSECFDTQVDILDRSIYLADGFIDDLIRYGKRVQLEKGAVSLFGNSDANKIKKPIPKNIPEKSVLFFLEKEKEYLGVYLSGHPLDYFKEEIARFNKNGVVKTKKYGSLVLFDRISDFLASKYNKSIIAAYCDSESFIKRKRTTNKIVSLGSEFETYVFEDREFGNSGSMFMNEISGIEKQNGYLVVLERNKFTANGCTIIDVKELKSKN